MIVGAEISKHEVMICRSGEDNSCIAEVTELAGCMKDGDSMLSALENIHVVINEWIKTAKSLGREIPHPKGRLAYA